MRKLSLLLTLVSVGLIQTASSQTPDEQFVTESLEATRTFVEKNHLVALVTTDRPDGKNLEYQYDHFPALERLKLPDGVYARKKGGRWLKSDDWAVTGTKVNPTLSEQLDILVSFVEAPINNVIKSLDKNQGAQSMQLIKKTTEGETERRIYELRREKSTGIIYPQYVFDRPKEEKTAPGLLFGFFGPMYSGKDVVMVNITFDYLIAVNLTPAKTKKSL